MHQVKNLEVGVRRALVARFKEQKLSDEASEALADANLNEATSFVRVCYERRKSGSTRLPDHACWARAFGDLKDWSSDAKARLETAQREAESKRLKEERRLEKLAEEHAEAERARAETEKIETARLAELLEGEGRERAVTEEMETEHLADLIEESSAPKKMSFDFADDADFIEESESAPFEEPTSPEPAKKKSKKKK